MGFKVGEHVGADGFVGGVSGTRSKEFLVLVLDAAFGAREHFLPAVAGGGRPEGGEMGVHLTEESAVVGGGGGVDDVVDAGLGDDEGVGEGLAFGPFACDGGGGTGGRRKRRRSR